MKKTIKGQIIIYALLLISALLVFIPIAGQLISLSAKDTRMQLNYVARADNIAKAGLIDAISWFKRQTVQPVKGNGYYSYADAAFYPRESSGDTDDEDIGLVRDYQLSDDGLLWARYEVRRQKDPTSNPYDPQAVHDITDQRTSESVGEGWVWYIESHGYVYKRLDATKKYNEAPNKIIASARVATEIRRLLLKLPVNAACIVNYGGTSSNRKIRVYANGRLVGGSNAVGVARVSGYSAYIQTGGTVSGNPAQQSGIDNPTTEYVFGVTQAELKTLADFAVDSVNNLPNPLPTMSLIYINSSATFDSNRRLRGGGILYINGDLTVNSSSNTLYTGLIYVAGKTTIYGPALISGAVISLNGIDISGSGDVAEVDFDEDALNSVRQQLAFYRENKAAYFTFTALTE